jgi:hypothetical protein
MNRTLSFCTAFPDPAKDNGTEWANEVPLATAGGKALSAGQTKVLETFTANKDAVNAKSSPFLSQAEIDAMWTRVSDLTGSKRIPRGFTFRDPHW